MYGRLQGKDLAFAASSRCASSGRPLHFEIDTALTVHSVPEGSEPIFCLPVVDLDKTREPSILDIF